MRMCVAHVLANQPRTVDGPLATPVATTLDTHSQSLQVDLVTTTAQTFWLHKVV